MPEQGKENARKALKDFQLQQEAANKRKITEEQAEAARVKAERKRIEAENQKERELFLEYLLEAEDQISKLPNPYTSKFHVDKLWYVPQQGWHRNIYSGQLKREERKVHSWWMSYPRREYKVSQLHGQKTVEPYEGVWLSLRVRSGNNTAVEGVMKMHNGDDSYAAVSLESPEHHQATVSPHEIGLIVKEGKRPSRVSRRTERSGRAKTLGMLRFFNSLKSVAEWPQLLDFMFLYSARLNHNFRANQIDMVREVAQAIKYAQAGEVPSETCKIVEPPDYDY